MILSGKVIVQNYYLLIFLKVISLKVILYIKYDIIEYDITNFFEYSILYKFYFILSNMILQILYYIILYIKYDIISQSAC